MLELVTATARLPLIVVFEPLWCVLVELDVQASLVAVVLQTTERSSSEQQAARIVVRAVIALVILGESRVGQVVTKRSVDDGRLLLRVRGARDIAIESDCDRHNWCARRAWRWQRRWQYLRSDTTIVS